MDKDVQKLVTRAYELFVLGKVEVELLAMENCMSFP
jgi:hypothetical protein